MFKAISFFITLIFCTPLITFGQHSLEGNWKGYIDLMGNHLKINTHFKKHGNKLTGTIDIPQQGARGLNLQQIARPEKDSVSFGFPAGPGYATFSGTINSDSTISGIFTQHRQQFPFKLTRSPQAESETVSKKQPALPYHHKDLIIQNGPVKIGGTLTRPENKPADQLVILISGSGAQDRDESLDPITSFKPFAMLADSLTFHGIATFRYDDRGIGESTGNFYQATLDTLASDLESIIHHFSKASADHNFKHIVLLGHSQGGILAGRVAAKNSNVDRVILMSSPGISLKKVLRYQVRQSFEASDIPDNQIKKEISAREQLMDALRKDKNISEAKAKYLHAFEAIQRKTLQAANKDTSNVSSMGKKQTQALVSGYGSPQMQSLLFYDPAKDLKKLRIPVLVLMGGKDIQVPIDKNEKPIKDALESAGTSYKIETFPEANHLYQNAKTGKVSEYTKLPSKFVDGFITTIIQWLQSPQ